MAGPKAHRFTTAPPAILPTPHPVWPAFSTPAGQFNPGAGQLNQRPVKLMDEQNGLAFCTASIVVRALAENVPFDKRLSPPLLNSGFCDFTHSVTNPLTSIAVSWHLLETGLSVLSEFDVWWGSGNQIDILCGSCWRPACEDGTHPAYPTMPCSVSGSVIPMHQNPLWVRAGHCRRGQRPRGC